MMAKPRRRVFAHPDLPLGSRVHIDVDGVRVDAPASAKGPTFAYVDDRIGREGKGRGVGLDRESWPILRSILVSADVVFVRIFDGRPKHELRAIGGNDPKHIAVLQRNLNGKDIVLHIDAQSERLRHWISEVRKWCAPDCEMFALDAHGVFRITSEVA